MTTIGNTRSVVGFRKSSTQIVVVTLSALLGASHGNVAAQSPADGFPNLGQISIAVSGTGGSGPGSAQVRIQAVLPGATPGTVVLLQGKSALDAVAPWTTIGPLMFQSNSVEWQGVVPRQESQFYRLKSPGPQIFRIEPSLVSMQGGLIRIVDTLGHTNTVAYTPDGFISAVTDFSRRVVRHGYAPSGGSPTPGVLSFLTDPPVTGTPNGNDIPDGRVTPYADSSVFTDEQLNQNLTNAITVSIPGGAATNILTGQTLWVDPLNGDNATAVRGNQTLQYLTLAAASTAAQNGDTIMVRPGTNIVTPGTATFNNRMNVTVKGFGPGSVLQASAQGQIIVVSNCLNFHISDVTLKGVVTTKTNGVGYYALLEMGGTNYNVTVNNCTVMNSVHGIAALNGPRSSYGTRILNNYFEQIGTLDNGSGTSDGTAVAVGGSDGMIAFNRMHNVFRGVEVEGTVTGDSKRRIRVTGNTITGIWTGGSDVGFGIGVIANSCDGASNLLGVEISGNVVDASPESGLNTWGISSSGGDELTIRDNKVRHVLRGIYIAAAMPMSKGQITGNQVASGTHDSGYAIEVTGTGTNQVSGFTIQNNLLWPGTVAGAFGSGMRISGVNHLISGNHVCDSYGHGVTIAKIGGGLSTSNNFVANNLVLSNASSGIYIESGVLGTVLRDNLVQDNGVISWGFVTNLVDNGTATDKLTVNQLLAGDGEGNFFSTNAVDWTQLINVPAGFADGTDDGAGGVGDTSFTDFSQTFFRTNGAAGNKIYPTNLASAVILDGTILNEDINDSAAIDKSKISTSSTWPDADLSANIPRLNGAPTFSGVVAITNLGNTISGDGAGLTNLGAANLATGTLSVARGGTGDGSHHSGNVLFGQGTGAFTNLATTGSGNVMRTRTGINRTLWFDARAMTGSTTNGAAFLTNTVAGGDYYTGGAFAFDDTTAESVQFRLAMPDEWDRGTIKARFYWTTTSGTGDVAWKIAAGAASNADALGAILGTEIEVDDTRIADNVVHVTAATAAIDVGGTPAQDGIVNFKVRRDPADAGDTKTDDALLLGVKIQYLESTTEPSTW